METYYDIKEEYLNILNELPKLPSMPDIGEPDVILAGGERWKSGIELPRKLLPWVLSEHEKLAELVAFFHLVPEGNVNVKQHE